MCGKASHFRHLYFNSILFLLLRYSRNATFSNPISFPQSIGFRHVIVIDALQLTNLHKKSITSKPYVQHMNDIQPGFNTAYSKMLMINPMTTIWAEL